VSGSEYLDRCNDEKGRKKGAARPRSTGKLGKIILEREKLIRKI
jgi:hypothetical protein